MVKKNLDLKKILKIKQNMKKNESDREKINPLTKKEEEKKLKEDKEKADKDNNSILPV